MIRYIVTVPNLQYAGKAAGVRFANGRAVVDNLTLDPSLKRSLEDTVKLFHDLGYTVQAVDENGNNIAEQPNIVPVPEKPAAKKSAASPRNKKS